MKPLLILLITFILSVVTIKFRKGCWETAKAARMSMAVMLLFTALGHFLFAEGMAMMIPDLFPFKLALVYLTGILEIAAAVGLHIPRFRKLTAWLLILFFVMVLPANIQAAIEQINYQTGTFDGHNLVYLWFRIPLQLLFIGWVYFSSIKALKYKNRSGTPAVKVNQ